MCCFGAHWCISSSVQNEHTWNHIKRERLIYLSFYNTKGCEIKQNFRKTRITSINWTTILYVVCNLAQSVCVCVSLLLLLSYVLLMFIVHSFCCFCGDVLIGETHYDLFKNCYIKCLNNTLQTTKISWCVEWGFKRLLTEKWWWWNKLYYTKSNEKASTLSGNVVISQGIKPRVRN